MFRGSLISDIYLSCSISKLSVMNASDSLLCCFSDRETGNSSKVSRAEDGVARAPRAGRDRLQSKFWECIANSTVNKLDILPAGM